MEALEKHNMVCRLAVGDGETAGLVAACVGLERSRAMPRMGDKVLRYVHFVGIGGAGMSAIALVALELGVQVTGSDLALSGITDRLEKRGARVSLGHAAAHLERPDAVVVSTAIRPDNPEVVEARRLGIPVLHRADMLSIIMDRKKGIAVSGTHGKSTTTSMMATVFERTGQKPTWVVGAEVRDFNSGAGYGEGEYLIAEADESDGSFLKLHPFVAVATNIDNDHLDHYGTFERLVEAFRTFLSQTRPDGFSVVCADDQNLVRLAGEAPGRVVTYSLGAGEGRGSRGTHYQVSGCFLEGWRSRFTVEREGTSLGEFALTVPGRHNVANATAVIATATEVGLPIREVASALADFSGTVRRLDPIGRARGVHVVDDYAHHPTEIAATLDAARGLASSGRVIVVFQPHRYTRTRDLHAEFGQAFGDADAVVLTDIYPAMEPPIPGVTGELVYRDFQARPGQSVVYIPELGDIAAHLAALVRPGDFVLTMGAGDVRRVGPELLLLLDGQGLPGPARRA